MYCVLPSHMSYDTKCCMSCARKHRCMAQHITVFNKSSCCVALGRCHREVLTSNSTLLPESWQGWDRGTLHLRCFLSLYLVKTSAPLAVCYYGTQILQQCCITISASASAVGLWKCLLKLCTTWKSLVYFPSLAFLGYR